MILPDLDPTGGPLRIDEVLIEYDGPQLFVARNKSNARLLALHISPDAGIDRWLYVRVSPARLRLLKAGQISLREPFEIPEYGVTAIVQYKGDDSTSVLSVQWLNAKELIDDVLPSISSFLEPDDWTDAKEVMAYAASPQPVREIIPRLESPLWELDRNVIDLLKHYRTPPHEAARITKRSVADLAFAVDAHRTDFPVRHLSAVLGTTQALFDSLAIDELKMSIPRGPIPGAICASTALDAVATFPSSFGLRIETHRGDIAGDSPAEVALIRLLGLLEAVRNEEHLSSLLRQVSRRAQNHFKAFAKAISAGGADFRIEAATPGQTATTRIYIARPRIEWLSKYLEREVDAVEDQIEFRGRLIGVSLKSRFFMLQGETEEIMGKISKECLKKVNEKKINVEYSAQIIARTEVNEATGEEHTKYTMIDLSEVEGQS